MLEGCRGVETVHGREEEEDGGGGGIKIQFSEREGGSFAGVEGGGEGGEGRVAAHAADPNAVKAQQGELITPQVPKLRFADEFPLASNQPPYAAHYGGRSFTTIASRRDGNCDPPTQEVVSQIARSLQRVLTPSLRRCSPNRLVVDESASDDNSVASINPSTMETLSLFRGDTIILRGKKRKDTGEPSRTLSHSPRTHPTLPAVLIVLSSEDVDEGKIQINTGQSPAPSLHSLHSPHLTARLRSISPPILTHRSLPFLPQSPETTSD